MKLKNFVLTMIGVGAIYKAGKLGGIVETVKAVGDELRENHGREMTYSHTIWPKRVVEVKITKFEEAE